MRTSTRRLAAAAAGLVGLAWVAAVPAGAHDQGGVHSMRWVDEDPNDSPDDGDRLYGVDFVAAEAQFDDKVLRWRAEMRPEAGGDPAFCDSGDIPEAERRSTHGFRCNWDTTRLGDMTHLGQDASLGSGPIAPNGVYVITVTAWNVGRDRGLISSEIPKNVAHTLPTRRVLVQNPVSAPQGVKRSYNSTTGKVTVTWAASPEPDVNKYVIQEKKGSGGWETVGERPHGATSFDRQILDAGTYQYRVAAARPEVAQSGFSEAPALEVAAPPPPPAPAGEAPPPDPGPEPGVTVYEPAPPATAPGAAAPAPSGPRPSSGGGGGRSLFTRPTAPRNPPRTTPTTADTGFSTELPYTVPTKRQGGAIENPELPDTEEGSITKLINVPTPRDPRSLLVPLAGGLAIFVFAMQMTFVVRKRPALAQMDDDFGDWTGI